MPAPSVNDVGPGRAAARRAGSVARRAGSVARRATPALVGLILIVGLAAVSLRIGAASLREAEESRMAAREHLVESAVSRTTFSQDNSAPAQYLAALPPSRTDPEASRPFVELLRSSALSPASQAVLLLGRDGRVLVASPSDASVAVADLQPAWDAALGGRRAVSDSFVDRGALSWAVLVPVGGDEPWAVLVQIRHSVESGDQDFVEQLGSLNGLPGGLVLVDRRGVALQSWNDDDLGRPHLSTEELGRISGSETTRWTAERDGRETTMIGRSLPSGHAYVFEQATDDLLGDLRAAQRQRDLTLMAVLAVALTALVAFQVSRELAARRAGRRLHTLLEHSADLILVCDARGRLLFASPALRTLLGHDADAWRGRSLADLACPDDGGRLTDLLLDPSAGALLDVQLRDATGEPVWFDFEASTFAGDRHGERILLTGHDARARRAGEAEVRRQATHDSLTGLPNRAALAERFEALTRAGEEPFAFLYLDLDGFKAVNDGLGHEAGDHLLSTLAARFAASVGDRGLVCRLGGDEFGILLEGEREHEAVELADELLVAARRPVPVGANIVAVGASIGIAVASPVEESATPEAILRQADQAMYDAKRSGRGRCCVFTGFPPSSAEVPMGERLADHARPEEGPGADGGHGPDDGHEAPAATGPTPSALPGGRRRWAAVAPVLAASAVVVGIAVLGQFQTDQARWSAESRLVDETLRTLPPAADYIGGFFDPSDASTVLAGLPFTVDGGPVDVAIIGATGGSAITGPGSITGLYLLDGTPLVTSPDGFTLGVRTDSPGWRRAAAGEVAVVPTVIDSDDTRFYMLIPLLRDGRPVAIMLSAQSQRTGTLQARNEQMSALGSGGISGVDADGKVYSSWDPELLGRTIADPAKLRGLSPGQARDVSADPDMVVVATVDERMSLPGPTYAVFSQPTEGFYRDLRTGQLARRAGLLALVIAAVAGLVVANLRRERAARGRREWLDSLLHQAHDIVAVVDGDEQVTFASSALSGLLGHDPGAWQGTPFPVWVDPEDRDRVVDLLTVASAGARAGSAVARTLADVRLLHADGSRRWFDIVAVGLHGHRDVRGTLLTCHEVSRRRALQDELSFQAVHDPLTGLPNRAAFAAGLEQLSGADAGAGGTAFAILYIDLDHFKPVNDALGHDAGDLVLRHVGAGLQAYVHAGNAEGPDLVCRLGGDEFAVLLAGAGEDRARARAADILEVIRQPIAVGADVVRIDATIGIAVSDGTAEHPLTTVRHADVAMYQAKAAGRSGFLVFSNN